MVLCCIRDPTSQLLRSVNNFVNHWVDVLLGPPPSTLCKYYKFPTYPTPRSHFWLSTRICLFYNTTSQKMGCGRMNLARVQPPIGIRKYGWTLKADPLFFSQTSNPKYRVFPLKVEHGKQACVPLQDTGSLWVRWKAIGGFGAKSNLNQLTFEKPHCGCSVETDYREAKMEKGDQLANGCRREAMWLGWGRYSLNVQPAGSADGSNVGYERRRGPRLMPASWKEGSCPFQDGEDWEKSRSKGKFTSSL